jgi:hypothetical protein
MRMAHQLIYAFLHKPTVTGGIRMQPSVTHTKPTWSYNYTNQHMAQLFMLVIVTNSG